MARPPVRVKAVRLLKYDTVEDCEDRDNDNQGYHVAQVKAWPPPRTRAGELVPYLSTTCMYCGVNMQVYANNDPEVSNFKVIVLEKESRK